MIKYIGSKRTIVPTIKALVAALPGVRSVADVFSGTSRVGHALKGAGLQVFANDHNAYAHALARCYVEADRELHADAARGIIAELMRVPARAGYVTEVFCRQARYFHPDNGERIDAIRDRIEALALPEPLRSVVLVSLMEAADRVDSTTGVQMAYLKQWAPRALRPLELRLPDLQPAVAHGPCRASRAEAVAFARGVAADVAYLDPPYNQHSYLGNYHVWETLVLWDRPEHYGIARKRADCRQRTSAFNSRPRFRAAFADLVAAIDARWLLVSFSNEGYLSRDDAVAVLSARGEVHTLSLDYKRYVGAQIGIYNPAGEKVGRVSHLRNVEHLYLVVPKGAGCPPAVAALGVA